MDLIYFSPSIYLLKNIVDFYDLVVVTILCITLEENNRDLVKGLMIICVGEAIYLILLCISFPYGLDCFSFPKFCTIVIRSDKLAHTGLLQSNRSIQWAMAECLDHHCFLGHSCICIALCNLLSVGPISELSTVCYNMQTSIINSMVPLLIFGWNFQCKNFAWNGSLHKNV